MSLLRPSVKRNPFRPAELTISLLFVFLSSSLPRFHVSAVHHAHEAHIVPDVLKKGWGGPPGRSHPSLFSPFFVRFGASNVSLSFARISVPSGAAIFAAFSRYKHEAYRHSVHAPKILADAGIKVAMKVRSNVVVSIFRHLAISCSIP